MRMRIAKMKSNWVMKVKKT